MITTIIILSVITILSFLAWLLCDMETISFHIDIGFEFSTLFLIAILVIAIIVLAIIVIF